MQFYVSFEIGFMRHYLNFTDVFWATIEYWAQWEIFKSISYEMIKFDKIYCFLKILRWHVLSQRRSLHLVSYSCIPGPIVYPKSTPRCAVTVNDHGDDKFDGIQVDCGKSQRSIWKEMKLHWITWRNASFEKWHRLFQERMDLWLPTSSNSVLSDSDFIDDNNQLNQTADLSNCSAIAVVNAILYWVFNMVGAMSSIAPNPPHHHWRVDLWWCWRNKSQFKHKTSTIKLPHNCTIANRGVVLLSYKNDAHCKKVIQNGT